MDPATPAVADESAAHSPDALFEAVYARLKAMAATQLKRTDHATLDTTALVHELYLRIGKQPGLAFQHPAHTKEIFWDTKFFTPEIRSDTVYVFDFNHPTDHSMGGSSELFRSQEVQLNNWEWAAISTMTTFARG